MSLKVDLRQFLDDEGNVLILTEQANTVFKFLCKIVLSVSKEAVSQDSLLQELLSPNIEQPFIDVDLKCCTRGNELSCRGHIEARCSSIATIPPIEWQCDTCEAAGTISNWQGSLCDKQERTMH